jgi:hypothetical protein
MCTMPRDPEDIGPDDAMSLDGERLAPNPDASLELAVTFTSRQLQALQEIADERGITAVDAVQRLVEEALEARAHRSAA